MKKYRVLQVIPLMHVGGTELSAKSLSQALLARGHSVTVMANEGPLFTEFQRAGLDVVQGDIHLRNIRGLIKGASDIKRCIANRNIEVVHFQNAFSSLMGPFAAGFRNRRCKLIWHCRGIHAYSYPVAARLSNHLSDFVIANCEYERDRLISKGCNPRKIKAVYNIPNVLIPSKIPPRNELILRELGIGSNERVVATIGNFYVDRGVSYFLDGARRVLEARRDVRFLVIGDGPLRKELRMQAEQQNLMKNLQFLGTRRDIEAIYSVIDLLVNPVLTGAGTGNVTAEAMAFAKPVVATNYGGLRELVKHMQTGILVPPRDGTAIAEAVLYLLENEDHAKRMGQGGRERILSDFTPEQVAAKVEQVYAHVLNGGCIETQHASLGGQSI